MERLIQYFDDLDDLYGMLGLINERLRRFLYVLFSYVLTSAGAIAGSMAGIAASAARTGNLHSVIRNTPVPIGNRTARKQATNCLKKPCPNVSRGLEIGCEAYIVSVP